MEDAVRQALTVLRAATQARLTQARLVLFGPDTYAVAARLAEAG